MADHIRLLFDDDVKFMALAPRTAHMLSMLNDSVSQFQLQTNTFNGSVCGMCHASHWFHSASILPLPQTHDTLFV